MAVAEPFYASPTFWVGVAFVVFVMVVMYAKAHKSIAKALDDRAASIQAQIEEANALRNEAENLLLEYQRKQRDAEKEAADMVDQARQDAKIMTKAAKADLDAMMKRRERSAAEKITQAETNAIKEVRAAAVDVAIKAASSVLATSMKGKAGTALVNDAIKGVQTKLH
jgi:F-type H+-transporting ATPase subunit b